MRGQQPNDNFPTNTNAERSILGGILLDNSLYSDVTEALCPEDFSLDSHRRIYAAMTRLVEANGPIDLVTLSEELGPRELESVGGAAYLSSLTEGGVKRTNLKHYLDILVEKSKLRRLANRASEIAQQALMHGASPEALLRRAENLFESVPKEDKDSRAPEFADEALALRFSNIYENGLRYTAAWSMWHFWNGFRWEQDETLHAFDLARAICRAASAECPKKNLARRVASAVTVAAVERLARADRRHVATVEQWDVDPWLLNTPGGTVDLRTGELHDHCREDYCTKTTAVAPSGDCPLWRAFLRRVTNKNNELELFLQRMVGYCLTGVTREHVLFFLYGPGANGKSVFLTTISEAMGDYARTSAIETFLASTGERHPTDLAGLHGARLVTAIEVEDGRRWAESRIKAVTGGDKIAARFMRQDYFEYTPQFKLLIAGNHKPALSTVDEAVRRRLHLVPFVVTIPVADRDPELVERLQSELPGVLQWAIEGCVAWLHDGLNAPDAVTEATNEYLAAEDALGRWLEERCVLGSSGFTSTTQLFGDFRTWCERNGEFVRSQRRFSDSLAARNGFRRLRTNQVRGFEGVILKQELT